MIVLGLDQSLSSTGVVVLDGDGRTKLLTKVKTKPNQFPKEVERMIYIKDVIGNICDQFYVDHAVMEDFSYNSIGNRLFQMGGLGYIIRELFHEKNIPCSIIKPTMLKKFATNSGAAKKNEVIDAVNKRWGQSLKIPGDTDIADAYVLAIMGLNI